MVPPVPGTVAGVVGVVAGGAPGAHVPVGVVHGVVPHELHQPPGPALVMLGLGVAVVAHLGLCEPVAPPQDP